MDSFKIHSLYELTEQKVLFKETETLSDAQLLSLIIRDHKDDKSTKANKLISSCDELTQLLNLSTNEIIRISKANKKQAISLCAMFELIKRITGIDGTQNIDIISNQLDIISMFRPKFINLKHEEFWAIYLTKTNQIIKIVKINTGGINSMFVDVKLILNKGICLLATAIIVVHNHPLSDASPSKEDIAFTDKLEESLELIDIKLLDHIIISKSDYYSFFSKIKTPLNNPNQK